ncbi:MAG: 16S rRNA (cytosine(1402)-N(4))-methyltransferase RsmH [Rhodospirillaceae bacterium]|nr:16S rRNA (cytosine(1402)-N(4))-methyltransferase RsmH [Rhodospirillaceae bacterium]
MVRLLAPADGDLLVDATFGRGGHTAALLRTARCRVVALDRDPAAVAAGQAMAAQSGGRLVVRQGRFGDMVRLVRAVTADPVDGVAMDLGVASPQLDDPARGFSFRTDGPLDMRMEAEGPTAADVVNTASEGELTRIFRELGEERYAGRVARAVVAARRIAPLARTLELADLVRRVVPRAKDGIDAATRSFQGLRLHVNDELGELDRGLAAAEHLLRPGGRLAVISFHSLEDRAVKRFLGERSGGGAGQSRHRPAAVDRTPPSPTFQVLTRKPVMPGPAEIAANPRARSARLRAALRTGAPSRAEAGEIAA